MKAVILEGINEPFTLTDLPKPIVGEKDVLVRIHAAALNHRDLWIQKGLYGGLRFPSIQGSDGSGVVVETGTAVDPSWMNKEVVINASLNWGKNPNTQAKDYIILGMAKDGTFAEYTLIPADRLHLKPPHLSFEEASAIPLAGLTAYRALITRAGAKAGETILVTGAGGGVALFAVQWALAIGCKVFVTSGSDAKIDAALKLGVSGGVNYKKENWHKELQTLSGGFDAAIDSSGGDTFARLVDICKPSGRIAMYGATLGAFSSGVPAKIFWKQITLCGSTMGNDDEFAAMMQLVEDKKIKPVIDSVYSLGDIQQAAQRMQDGAQFGKIVLNHMS
ncbi:MAG: zinc-binding dehydrogenase [Bacteroidia bacterium]|jgi:NADPH:quinone reductase-like Zn-dependent oxidoreductase